jgi:hypothetical protein
MRELRAQTRRQGIVGLETGIRLQAASGRLREGGSSTDDE